MPLPQRKFKTSGSAGSSSPIKPKPSLKPQTSGIPLFQRGEGGRGRFIILVGKPGVGKTTLADQFPSPLFLYDNQEFGAVELAEHGLLEGDVWAEPYDNFDKLLSQMRQILGIEHNYKTLVVEGLSGFQKLLFRKCQMNDYEGSHTKFMSFQNGPQTACSDKQYLPSFIELVEQFRRKGISVVMTGHTESKMKEQSMVGFAYDKEVILCNKYVVEAFGHYSEAICFIVNLPEKYEERNRQKIKSSGTMKTMCYAHATAFTEGKNRFGCNSVISFEGTPRENYNALCKAFSLNPKTLRKV